MYSILLKWIKLISLALLLSACVPAANQEEAPLPPTPTIDSATATPTIVWFPATSTPTAVPTRVITPTPIWKQGIGSQVLLDPLSEETEWETGRSSQGSIAYGNEEMTIAVSEPKATLTSMRSAPLLSDFYIEVTANANLCRDKDAYGVLLRAANFYNGYRFAVACDGTVRVERLKNGEVVALQNWTPSGQARPGAPLTIRLGILAVGKEIRFFIDDVYQFSTTDPVWSSGNIGLFARSTGDSPVTISFSDLVVYNVNSSGVSNLPPTPTEALPTETSKQ